MYLHERTLWPCNQHWPKPAVLPRNILNYMIINSICEIYIFVRPITLSQGTMKKTTCLNTVWLISVAFVFIHENRITKC